MIRHVALPALALALCAAAPAEKPPLLVKQATPARSLDAEFSALGAWMRQLNDALAISNQAVAGFAARAREVTPDLQDPNRVKAAAARLKVMLGEVREEVKRSQAALDAIPPYDSALARSAGLDIGKMLVDAREQEGNMLAYVEDFEALAAGAERGDAAVIRAAGPKLLQGSLLLIDNTIVVLRGRQAAFPSNRSSHQVIGVSLQLYKAMGLGLRTWLRAHLGDEADAAAAEQNRQLKTLALELGTITEAGRDNMRRELAEIDRLKAQNGRDSSFVRAMDRTRELLLREELIYAVGDELAASLNGASTVTGDALRRQDAPEMVRQLSPLEQRLVGIAAETARLMAGSA